MKIVWPNTEKIAIQSIRCNRPLQAMVNDCKHRLEYGGEDNYHIFLNSVAGITTIIRNAGLRPEQCRIVCSLNSSSKN